MATMPVGSGISVITRHRFPARSDGHHDGQPARTRSLMSAYAHHLSQTPAPAT
jgi:hypothetical protein